MTTEKTPIAPADDETVDLLEMRANEGLSVTPESALALIARIRLLVAINADLMGDDETKPRYTTKRLKLEIAKAVEAMTRERDEAIRRLMSASDWFWPEDDTSSEACGMSPREALEFLDAGEVAPYACGGVVRIGYFGWLPPADDADDDDDFEVDEPSEEMARSKIDAELAARAARKAAS